MLNLEAIKKILSEYLKSKPISRAWIFGSYARGEETPGSDIDLLVDFSDPISLFAHAAMIIELKKILGIEVDLVPRDSVFPEILPFVEKDKILIYERRN